ncbi:MAG: hypothetical protein N2Z57_04175 [Oscillospiraceae bacterium]|nr:hypothetical protein [Oscillospiraceae bacterium]
MKGKCKITCLIHRERLKVFLILLSSLLILAVLCFCLYWWANGVDFIFSPDFPFFKSHEIKGVNSVRLDEPLEYSDGVTITAKRIYFSEHKTEITMEIENNSDRDVEFSSLQFELTVQKVGQDVLREYYSPSYSWVIDVPKGSKSELTETFAFEVNEDCSFSLSIYNEKNEKAGQILFALSDIEQNSK